MQQPDYQDGWAPVHGFSFSADDGGVTFGHITIIRNSDHASPLLAGDVAGETRFDWVELDLNAPDAPLGPGGRMRLRLEDVMVAAWHMLGDGFRGQAPSESFDLTFSAVTYIYLPGEADNAEGTYGQINLVSGSGDSSPYTQRDPDNPRPFAVMLRQAAGLPPGYLRLSWVHEPGIRYALQFTADLREPFRTILGQPEIVGNERVLVIPDDPGFYRVIEQ